MQTPISAPLFAGSLFVAMLFFMEIGRRFGINRHAKDPEGARAGISAVEGAVYGLLSLLIAFTFSGASSRYDTRRTLIVQEANAIGTAYLRLDLLPADTQPALRDQFRRYVDARIAVYKDVSDMDSTFAALANANKLQNEIWTSAVVAVRRAEAPGVNTLVMASLNDMIDITTTRTAAGFSHPPFVIFAMLYALALASSLLTGFAMAPGKMFRNVILAIGFASTMAGAVYVTLEIEYPRLGFIRVDYMDQILVQVRNSMSAS